jgi:UDP-2,4-diacetamido-2,4,6-trideoxy-beta-L-altropyranose hydrolase
MKHMRSVSQTIHTRNLKNARLLLRADATVSIGSGHVIRCLALAQAWQEAGGCVTLATGEMLGGLVATVAASGVSLAPLGAIPGSADDARATLALSHDLNAVWTVLDGDRFTNMFLNSIRDSETRLLLIDDFANRDGSSLDLIVNPNCGVDAASYNGAVPVLIGPKYALLRRAFRNPRARQIRDTANRILITLGGSDPDNLTPRVVSALAAVPDLLLTVVAGPGNKNTERLMAFRSDNVKVLVDPPNMAELMQDCDLGIIAAGGTLWECLAAGCIVLSYSRNAIHQMVLQDLAAMGVLVDLGLTSHFDPGVLGSAVLGIAEASLRRANMVSMGAELVDGFGADRVVDAMCSPLQSLP